MSDLFYDTWLRNRTFHNHTSVKLSNEQVKLLALNPKFIPKPSATRIEPTLEAVDNFSHRLRLRVDHEVNTRTLDKHWGEATE